MKTFHMHTHSIIQKTARHGLTHRAAASDTYPLELTPRICKKVSRSSWNYPLVHLHSKGVNVHLFTWKQSTYSLFYYRKQHMTYPARLPINHLKLLKDSAGKSVPGTRNSSLAQEMKHGICESLHMKASIQYTHFYFLWYRKQREMAYLTELPQTYSIPQDFARKPATPGTTNCPPAHTAEG